MIEHCYNLLDIVIWPVTTVIVSFVIKAMAVKTTSLLYYGLEK